MAKLPPSDGGWDRFGKPLPTSHSSPSQWQSPYSSNPQNPQSNLTASHWTQAQAGLSGQHNLASRYMYVNQYINFPPYQSNGILIGQGINEHSNNINPYQNLNSNIARAHGNNSHHTPSADGYQSFLQNNDSSGANRSRLTPPNNAPHTSMGPLAPPVNERVTSLQKKRNTSRIKLPLKNPDGIYSAPTAPTPQKRRGRPRKEVSTQKVPTQKVSTQKVSTQKTASKMKKPQVSRNRKSSSGSRPVASSPPNCPGESPADPIEIHSPEQDSQIVLKKKTHRSWPPSSAPNAPRPSHPVLLPGRRPSHENRPRTSLVARNCHSQPSTHLPQTTRYIQAPAPNPCPQTTPGSWNAHLQQSSPKLGLMKSPPRLVLRMPDRQQCPQIAMNNSYSQPAQQDANPHYQYPAYSSQALQITQGSICVSSHQESSSLEGPSELSIHPEIYVPNAQLRPETPRTNLDPYPRQQQIQQQHQPHNYLDLQAPPQIYPSISQTMNLGGMPGPAFPDVNQWLSSTQPTHLPFMMGTGAPSIPLKTKIPVSTHSSMPIAQPSDQTHLIKGATNSTHSLDAEIVHTKLDEQVQVPALRDWPIIIYPNISIFLERSEEFGDPAQDPSEEPGPKSPKQSPAEDIGNLIPEDDSWLRDTEEAEEVVNEWLDVWDSEGLLNRGFL